MNNRLENGMSQGDKKISILTPDEMVSIEFLAQQMGTEIYGSASVAFWPFPIIRKLTEEIHILQAEAQSMKHHWKNLEEEFVRVKARIDVLEEHTHYHHGTAQMFKPEKK